MNALNGRIDFTNKDLAATSPGGFWRFGDGTDGGLGIFSWEICLVFGCFLACLFGVFEIFSEKESLPGGLFGGLSFVFECLAGWLEYCSVLGLHSFLMCSCCLGSWGRRVTKHFALLMASAFSFEAL